MTDGPEPFGVKREDGVDSTVASLASRAIVVLASQRARGRPLLSERLVTQLSDAAHALNPAAVNGAITDLLHTGVPTDEIVDFYIPEAARRLGTAWCEDGLGFAEVTIGSARLQRCLRTLATAPRDPGTETGKAHASVLVAVHRNETHTLGAMVLTDQLRRRGYSVRLLLCEPDETIVHTVAVGHFEAIFLSAGVVETLADVGDLVKKLRASLRRQTPIVVGGAVAQSGAEITRVTGADYAATDVREAVWQCGLSSPHLGKGQSVLSG